MDLSQDDVYWTSSAGTVIKAQMDGSNATLLVSGLSWPSGIVVDYDASRLFWAAHPTNSIQSTNLAGGDIRMVVQLAGRHRALGPRFAWKQAVLGEFCSKAVAKLERMFVCCTLERTLFPI